MLNRLFFTNSKMTSPHRPPRRRWLCLTLALLAISRFAAAISSAGTDFWLAFPTNHPVTTPTLTVFVSGAPFTTGLVEVPGAALNYPYTVGPSGIVSIALPMSLQLSGFAEYTQPKGVHVTASQPVSVYGLNRAQFSTDAYLGLPVAALGTDYRVVAYQNTNSLVLGSQMTVVGTENGTTVTIIPHSDVSGHAAGVPFTITLNAGDAYELNEIATLGGDVSGTQVTSTRPVAVFGGHLCANVPSLANGGCCCDHMVEQMFPLHAWGRQFVTMPLATRSGGDLFRVTASADGTVVSIDGVPQAPLAAGGFLDVVLASPSSISADQPVALVQYSQSGDVDGVVSDPFEMVVPPFEQFGKSYTVSTPQSGFAQNFINVVAPASAVGAITLDGSPIPAGLFTPIGASGFFGAQVPVALGSHQLDGPDPYGVSVYGFDTADSYGYPGGSEIEVIVTVTPAGTFTNSPTITATFSASPTPTASFSSSATRSVTPTFSASPTPTASFSSSATPSLTPSRTETPSATATPSRTQSPTVTLTASPSQTSTVTSTFSATPSVTPTPSITPTHSISPTFSPSPTAVPIPGDLGFGPTYPNPFRETVHVALLSKSDQPAKLSVYNVAGEPVFSESLRLRVGLTMWDWPGSNQNGGRCASGAYLIRLTPEEQGHGGAQFTWVVISR
jgi:hypothetical protein